MYRYFLLALGGAIGTVGRYSVQAAVHRFISYSFPWGTMAVNLTGSFIIGFLYNFGQAMFPDLAYVILFLPMLLVLVLRPQGLFGRA